MLSVYRSCCEWVQQRWVLAIMGFLCSTTTSVLEICLSLALTEMVVKTNHSEHYDDTCVYQNDSINWQTIATGNMAAGTYEWDEKLQGLILSSLFWGFTLSQIASGMLVGKIGGKYVLGFGVLEMSMLTLLTPFAIQTGGSTALIFVRFLIGVGEGLVYPATNVLLSQWAPPSERSKIGSLVFSGNAIGGLIGYMVTGFLIDRSSLGWPSIFYVFGSSGVIWCFLWSILCYNSPDEHPFISEKEKNFLHDEMSEHKHKILPPIPWRHILRSAPFWAFVISSAGQDWSCVTLTVHFPKYVSSVLKFPASANGLLLGLSALLLWLSTIPISWMADWLINSGRMSRTNVRKLFTTLSSLGPSFFLVVGSYVGCDRVSKTALLVVGVTLMGGLFSGVKVNPLDLSPNYSESLLAIAGSLGYMSGMIMPYVVAMLTPNQTMDEWKLVFWVICVIYCLTNSVFIAYASGEVQYWNDPEFLIREQEVRSSIAIAEQPQPPKNSPTLLMKNQNPFT